MLAFSDLISFEHCPKNALGMKLTSFFPHFPIKGRMELMETPRALAKSTNF